MQYVEKRDGGYWVASTRVSLDSVVLVFLGGLTPEAIVADCFPILTLEQTYGAITWYLAHRLEFDAYLRKVDVEFDAFRQATRRATPTLSEKLNKVRRESLLAHQ